MKIIELKLTPEQGADERYIESQLGGGVSWWRVVRRSIDARRRGAIVVNLAVEVGYEADVQQQSTPIEYQQVAGKTPVVIVGAGPAGLFAALELIERGIKPIVVERGEDVSTRKLAIAAINRNEALNPESNYCFGEGGAGTYSDGKLFTRSKKRGDNRKVLEILVAHGAAEEILYQAHPHIGTDRLPRIIANIRATITAHGGEVHFSKRVTDLIINDNVARGVVCGDERIEGAAVILVTGHSARDVYEMLHARGILLEEKSFAMGVRVEHRQELINHIQYHGDTSVHLPAASYSLVAQVGGRGVYSFCMCPGGFIVPAATAAGECVVNGMSPSGRNNIYANSGIVTEVRPSDYASFVPHFGVLAGMKFQQQVEMMGSFQAGQQAQTAPAQLVTEFVAGKKATKTIPTSYHPGVVASDMDKWLPRFIGEALQGGFREFEKRMRGFITADAQVIGVESRTSSPLRIPRSKETLCHPQIAGLYPSGEGAGYAGGIVSSAVDGAAVAARIVI